MTNQDEAQARYERKLRPFDLQELTPPGPPAAPAVQPYTARNLIELVADSLLDANLATDEAPGLIVAIPDPTAPTGYREFIIEAREVD